MSVDRLDTARLHGEPIESAHRDGLIAMLADPRVGPLGLADGVSFTLPHNRASLRVMEKLGFAFERETIHAGLPHVLYRRLRASSARSTSRSVV